VRAALPRVLRAQFLIVALCAGFCAPARAEDARPVFDYSARALGRADAASLADLAGKVVLLNSWATWCAPCLVELPDFETLYRRDRDKGLEIIGVNIDEGEVDEKVGRLVQKLGLTFPIWRDPRNRFAKRFRVLGVPETLLIGRDGVILRRWNGPMDPAEPDNRASIEQALAQAAGQVSGQGSRQVSEHASEHASDPAAAPGAASAAALQAEDGKALIARGRRLAEQRGCVTCHSTDGAPGAGPSWKGLTGGEAILDDGRRVPRDEAYLTRAIAEPDAEIVEGYAKGVMSGAIPGKPLTPSELSALVRYLQSL
jgi:cytochrome c-type biogenesis protein